MPLRSALPSCVALADAAPSTEKIEMVDRTRGWRTLQQSFISEIARLTGFLRSNRLGQFNTITSLCKTSKSCARVVPPMLRGPSDFYLPVLLGRNRRKVREKESRKGEYLPSSRLRSARLHAMKM